MERCCIERAVGRGTLAGTHAREGLGGGGSHGLVGGRWIREMRWCIPSIERQRLLLTR